MSTQTKRKSFLDSAEGVRILEVLTKMSEDTIYNTEASYSANTDQYPNNLIPFVDKHMNYLYVHPSVNIEHYVSNLRMMTRLR